MELSLKRSELKEYIRGQVERFFPDKYKMRGNEIDYSFSLGLDRLEYCFKYIRIRGYYKNDMPYFYHLHSDQYVQFLWFFANSLWQYSANQPICDKLSLLGKTLSGMWVTYKCPLPNIFIFSHPVGTVLGNVQYSDFLVVNQNVTVQTNEDSFLGKALFLGSGAKIIGNVKIGDKVSIGVNSCVYKDHIQNNTLVYTDKYGMLLQKRQISHCAAEQFFYMEEFECVKA